MKSLFYSILILFSLQLPAQTIYNIRNYGASPANSLTANTSAIQNAIDACSGGGGGVVLVDSGLFNTSTLVLKDNVTLNIATGATLKAPKLNSDYPEQFYDRESWSRTYTNRSLIFAQGAHNVRITGGGTIDCNGKDLSMFSVTKNFRPFGIRIHRCTGVVIDNIRLLTAPQWMIHIEDCDTVHFYKIDITNLGLGSNDGIDIDGCRHVLVEDCTINSNDDPMVVKTHSAAPAEDILIRKCTLATYERGVKVGNESCGPMRRIRFEDITIKKSTWGVSLAPANAIYVAVADGGLIDSVSFERIDVQTPYETPVFIRLCNRGNKYDPNMAAPPVQYLRNVLIKDVRVVAARAIPSSITGIPGYYPENIRLENIAIAALGDTAVQFGPDIKELETTRPEPDIWGDSLPAYGFYVRHAKKVSFENVCIDLQNPDKRPAYYLEDTAAIRINACTKPYNHIEGILDPAITKIYPNPTTGNIYAEIPEHANIDEISLHDMAGKVFDIEATRINPTTIMLSTEHLNKGVYILRTLIKGRHNSIRTVKL